jgi:hypothetical protein
MHTITVSFDILSTMSAVAGCERALGGTTNDEQENVLTPPRTVNLYAK